MIVREQADKLMQELVEGVNQHDTRRVMKLYADNACAVSPVAGEIVGIEAITNWWETTFSLFPDWSATLSDMLIDGDRLAFFGTIKATDQNGWFGLPPTGQPFEYRGMVVLTLSEGKIVRDERIYDLTILLQHFEKARLDKELRMAAEVQHALLSKPQNAAGHCDVMGDSIPCRAIGGDFFESIRLPSGDFAVALGDVAGKGPASAIVASMIQGMLAIQLQTETKPSATLAHLNRSMISRHLQPKFATLVYGILSPNGRFTHTNAGHNPPIVLTRNGIYRLSRGGPILGVFSDVRLEEETLSLDDGDTVIMFSDGVVEARDSQDQEFGENRLLACVSECANKPVPEVLQGILASVKQFCEGAPQADDITVLVTRYREPRQS